MPDDVSITGFDNISWTDVVKPRLTTIAQPVGAIGAKAVELMQERMSGEKIATRRTIFDVALIERDSVRHLARPMMTGEISMASTPRIAVVGSANTDLITFSDKFPQAGETLFGRRFDLGFGGKGANQAIAARLCGAEVVMVAKVGDDLFGEATIKNFAVVWN